MIELDASEIHVWLSFYDEINDPALLDFYMTLLNHAERLQQSRFYFPRDRKRYLVTRALVRLVLSRYASPRPQDWTFRVNDYGRPEVLMPYSNAGNISFNVSHTMGLIVLAIAKRRAVGIDVENVRTREASIEVVERYFAPSEVSDLLAVPPSQQHDRFFEFWTFKESYIKARGMGLSIPLDKFSFDLSSDREVNLSIDPVLSDRAQRWRFWQFRPRGEYLVALCAERSEVSDQQITVRITVPGQFESVAPVTFLRASD